MTMERAPGAHGGARAGVPSGFRRLTPGLLHTDRVAEAFAGLPEGLSPGQVLGAFKAAAMRLGLSPRLVHAVDWLFRFTQAQDWGAGGRPIVWPSAALQQTALGLSPTQVKAINRALIEAGVIAMRDSPNGKRYGQRDARGQIVEAYGFDLSPLALRHAEFVRLAEQGRAERLLLGRLRRRATIARKGIAQILEAAAEYGLDGEEWQQLARESGQLVRVLRGIEHPDEVTLGVESLERRQRLARERLETQLAEHPIRVSKAVETDPRGSENRPHQYTYKPPLDPLPDTVAARDERWSDAVGPIRTGSATAGPEKPDSGRSMERTELDGPGFRLGSDELLRLAPRLRDYVPSATPSWPQLVEAADWLRGDLGVSRSLWGEACLAMGREQAALALALVSARPASHFQTSAGGYFHGMVAKAKAGELHLARTIWGLRARNRDATRGH